jgi:hypothetical protein
MIHITLIAAQSTDAVLPLVALLLKGVAFGAKKHSIKRAIVDTVKDVTKDKIKDEIEKKTSDKKKDN